MPVRTVAIAVAVVAALVIVGWFAAPLVIQTATGGSTGTPHTPEKKTYDETQYGIMIHVLEKQATVDEYGQRRLSLVTSAGTFDVAPSVYDAVAGERTYYFELDGEQITKVNREVDAT